MRLPNLIIAGASKSGTTTLHDVLDQHPQIAMTRVKETSFFSNDQAYGRGLQWYSDFYFAGLPATPWTGESTPHYLPFEKSAERMAADLGADTRIVLMLRNPVDRAYSLYWHTRRDGHEPLDFEAALDAEDKRLRETDWTERGSIVHAYQRSGLYGTQLEAFWRHLSPDHTHVCFFADFKRDPHEVASGIAQFLDLPPPPPVPPPQAKNTASQPRSMWLQKYVVKGIPRAARRLRPLVPDRLQAPLLQAFYRIEPRLYALNQRSFQYPPMRAETRARLAASFDADTQLLEQLIGRRVPWRSGD